MSEPLDFHCFYTFNQFQFGGENVRISIWPAIKGMEQTAAFNANGVIINTPNPDEPNEIFATFEDALAFYYNDAASNVIDALNYEAGEIKYHLGNQILVEKTVQTELDKKVDIV